MDDVFATRAAIARALDDADAAIARVRHAQQVEWVSVLASRYREELFSVIQDLVGFRDRLDTARAELA